MQIIPNDILSRRNQIKDCIANARLGKAIKHLIDFVRDINMELEDDVILISMEFSELENELRNELLRYEEGKLAKRKIAHRILQTLKVVIEDLS